MPDGQETLQPDRGSEREVVVQQVGLGPDGIELTWMLLPDDVRSEGLLVSTRATAIAFGAPAGLGELAVDLRTLVHTIASKLADELELLPVTEPPKAEKLGYSLPVVDDDDEDVGMGDGV